jgi:hypothetical protein
VTEPDGSPVEEHGTQNGVEVGSHDGVATEFGNFGKGRFHQVRKAAGRGAEAALAEECNQAEGLLDGAAGDVAGSEDGGRGKGNVLRAEYVGHELFRQ